MEETSRSFSHSEESLRRLVAALPEVVFVLDWDGRFLDVAPTRIVIEHPRIEQFVGKTVQEVLPAGEADMFLGQIRQCLTSGETISAQYYIELGDRSRWVLATMAPGLEGSVICVSRDVSERRSSEKLRDVFVTLGAQLSAAQTPREVATAILAAAETLVGWDCSFVDAYTPDEKMLHSIIGYDTHAGERLQVPPALKGRNIGPLTQRALDSGAFVHTRDKSYDGRPMFGFDRPSMSLLFAPIRNGRENVGVISIQSYTYNAYTEDDVHLLQALSDYCGGALQRTFAEQNVRAGQEALALRDERFRKLIENSSDVVMLISEDLQVLYISPSIERVLGYSAEKIVNTDVRTLLHPDDEQVWKAELERLLSGRELPSIMEIRVLNSRGQWRWIECVSQNLLAEPSVSAIVSNFRDISEQKATREELAHGAYHDALTGLPNRMAFVEQLERDLAHFARRSGYLFAVLFLDLDRFKVINDSLGHAMGDKLLIEASARILSCLRSGDIAARLGGDEFAVLLGDLDDAADATRVADRIQSELKLPFILSGSEVHTSASIGIAVSTSGYAHAEDILRDADTAMYRAKGLGKSQYAIFDAAMHARMVNQLQLENDMRYAVPRGELVLHYQPIVALDTGVVIGFEALVRWNHPERGMIYPGDFIEIAEETGIIVPISYWVIHEACRWMKAWQVESSLARKMSININISAKVFSQSDVVTRIQQILEDTGIDGSFVRLEITESAIIDNAERAVLMLSRLKQLDVQLQVDDFGTGYSSLSYLHRFPIDALKIDRSFVQRLDESDEALEISRAVVALAHNMKMEAIAEGIETVEQLQGLKNLGCRFGQGFLFSRPLPGDEAIHLVNAILGR